MRKAVLIDCSRRDIADRAVEKFPGKFLAETLSESILTSRREAPKDDDKTCSGHEVLRFFTGSPYEQAVAILWLEPGVERDEVFEAARNFVKNHSAKPWSIETGDLRYFLWADPKDDDQVVPLFLRGNTKHRAEWFVEVNGLRCLADAHGFAVMADSYGAARAVRAAQIMALAMAYQNALHEITDTIGRAAKVEQSHAEEALKRVSFFMAGHYLAHPILPNTLELRSFYGLLMEKQDIAYQYSEAVSQAELLARVVREEQRAQQDERERRIARRVNRLSTRLTIASVVFAVFGVFQVTPRSVRAWWDAWIGGQPATTQPSAVANSSTSISVGDSGHPTSREQRCHSGGSNRSGSRGAEHCTGVSRHRSGRAG